MIFKLWLFNTCEICQPWKISIQGEIYTQTQNKGAQKQKSEN